jgi:D-cysteine desulfhydrase
MKTHFFRGTGPLHGVQQRPLSLPGPWECAKETSKRPLTRLLARPARCIELARLPTPVEPAPWLGNQAWIKRDDGTSDLYGGGKVRKLEWLLGSAEYSHPGAVVSVGAVGSHHLVALGLFLAKSGRQLHALTFPQMMTPHVRENLAVLVSIGTRFWHVPSRAHLPLAYLKYRSALGAQRGTWMDAGGSSARGSLGFVSAGLELAEQVQKGEIPHPRRIFVTGGSGGTPAGLIIGLSLAGLPTVVHVTSAVERWLLNPWLLQRKMQQIVNELRALGVPLPGTAAELCASAGVRWEVDHSQLGGGYGQSTVHAERAVELAGRSGVALETTYTGKCIAALRKHTGQQSTRDEPILFWNTQANTDLLRFAQAGWEERAHAAGTLPNPGRGRSAGEYGGLSRANQA